MKNWKSGLVATALLGALAAGTATEAAAMPAAPLPTGALASPEGVQPARLICGPFRCFRTYTYYYRRPIFRRYYFRRYYYRRFY